MDWKPDTGGGPRIISGTRVIYEIVFPAEMTAQQRFHFPIVMALLAKDIGIEEQRLDAMVEAGGLAGVLAKTAS